MKNGKKFFVALALGGIASLGGLFSANLLVKADSNHKFPYTNTILTQQNTNVEITNQKLNTALRSILGMSANESFKINSISNHPDFKAVETEAGSGIYTANKICLDLSGTGVTDITELCQFEFPTTLKAINLAENQITEEDLPKIIEFTNYTTASNVVYEERTISVATGVDKDSTRINLCFNNINLNSLNNTQLNHKNIIYGIQNFTQPHESGLVLKSEIEDCYYFFKDDDFNYLSLSFLKSFAGEEGATGFGHNTILPITKNNTNASDEALGNIRFIISGTNIGDKGYFYGWDKNAEFIVFTIGIDATHKFERMELFTLNNSLLNINGLSNPTWKVLGNPSTKKRGIHPVNINVTSEGKTRLVIINYEVVDTTAPTLELIGQQLVPARVNREFKDPGCKGYDSNGLEDISDRVMSNIQEALDINILGNYVITYTLTDEAGNKATPITRTVSIQQNVLDAIVINCNSDKNKLFTDKDITLEVRPDSGIPTNNYTNYQYFWYIDGDLKGSTFGDNISGKSTKTFIFDKIGDKNIKVILKARHKTSNELVEVYSEEYTLSIVAPTGNNDALIIAASIAVGIVLLIVGIVTIVRYKKSHKNSHSKTTAYHKKDTKKKKSDDSNHGSEIQVIKNYNGSNGGGNSNFRPNETTSNTPNNTNNKDGK